MDREKLLKELADVASELNQFEQTQSQLNKEYGRDKDRGVVEVRYDYRPEYDSFRINLNMPKEYFRTFVETRIKDLREELTKKYNLLYGND